MNLKKLTLEQLLLRLPHKVQVRFALDCANDVKHLMTDSRSLKALEVVALWLEDKATDKEVAIAAAYTAYFISIKEEALNVANFAAHVAFQTIKTIAYFTTAFYAHDAAYYAAKALNKDIKRYKTKLLKEFLTTLETELYYGDVK